MFQALYNSLSGLFSFSKSLNTVSNNISNMNTPGFRGGDSFFENVSGGKGVRLAGEGMRSQAGDIRETGNSTDLAIDGGGYFILRDDGGNEYYTRSGQFRFNEEGVLVDSVNGFEVVALDETGSTIPVDFDDYRTLAAEATTQVTISGNLAAASTNATVNPVTVFDKAGVAHALSVEFANNGDITPGSFLVTVKDETGAIVGTGELRFRTDGTPLDGYNTMTLDLTLSDVEQSVELDFGTAGALNGLTSLTGMPSNPSAKVKDGHGVLGVSEMSFDEKGVLQFVYSQTEKRSGPQIALALIPDEGSLEMIEGRLLSGSAVKEREIGRPSDANFGRIAGGSLEMSNVDLTQEFADLLIIQRGYQASSRVMTVSNEMIEQLYNSTRGG